MTGFFVKAMFLSNVKSVTSKDATLYAGALSDSRSSIADSSKGVLKQIIFSSFAILNSSSCHSNGVYAS